jgi:hypothetical protein
MAIMTSSEGRLRSQWLSAVDRDVKELDRDHSHGPRVSRVCFIFHIE